MTSDAPDDAVVERDGSVFEITVPTNQGTLRVRRFPGGDMTVKRGAREELYFPSEMAEAFKTVFGMLANQPTHEVDENAE